MAQVKDAVAHVIDAETEARDRLLAARAEAERIIGGARDRAAQLVAEARMRAARDERRIVAEAVTVAQAEGERMLATSEQAADRIALSGTDRLDEAAALIRERIVQSYGRS